jgi:hypothetical protein
MRRRKYTSRNRSTFCEKLERDRRNKWTSCNATVKGVQENRTNRTLARWFAFAIYNVSSLTKRLYRCVIERYKDQIIKRSFYRTISARNCTSFRACLLVCLCATIWLNFSGICFFLSFHVMKLLHPFGYVVLLSAKLIWNNKYHVSSLFRACRVWRNF